jgi:hypothetical protein
MIIENTIIDLRAHRTHPALHFANMSAVISDAMQIIEVIQAVRKIYIRIQGTGKEIHDTLHNVEIMEAELRFLQKTFASKKKMGNYPEMLVHEINLPHTNLN